jgi:hypothetical protein
MLEALVEYEELTRGTNQAEDNPTPHPAIVREVATGIVQLPDRGGFKE